MKTLPLIAVAAVNLSFFISTVGAQIWTQTGAPLTGWLSVAGSADGTKLVASSSDTFVSTKFGADVGGFADEFWRADGFIHERSKLVLTEPVETRVHLDERRRFVAPGIPLTNSVQLLFNRLLIHSTE